MLKYLFIRARKGSVSKGPDFSVVMLSPAKHLPEGCLWTKNGASRLAKTSRELSAVVASNFCEAICLLSCHAERSEVSLC
jgi:hypothetical protein